MLEGAILEFWSFWSHWGGFGVFFDPSSFVKVDGDSFFFFFWWLKLHVEAPYIIFKYHYFSFLSLIFSNQHSCFLFLSFRYGCMRNLSWFILLSFHSIGISRSTIKTTSSKRKRWMHSLNSWSTLLLSTSNGWLNDGTSRPWLAMVSRKNVSS